MNREANASMSAIKLALAAQRLRAELEGIDLLQSEPIAIIGLGCRFPGGASTPDQFWRLLESGTDAVREIPPERWDIDAYYDPDPSAPAKMSTRWAGLLDQVDQFDGEFFGIAPREAAAMDPQQRLLLEVAYETLNDAGRPPESLSDSSAGVFFAVYNTDYARLQFSDPATIGAHTSSGTSHGVAAGRLSYLLNLHGPSMAIDTACSSSLVAVHLACQSLRAGECSLALAGGVSTLITPEETISLSKWGMLAPDGRCKAFDAAANGFVRGEGCGIVALKRLTDALADGDRIYALVRGSAVNQDGRSTVLTAPNGLAQEAVLRQALKNARIVGAQVTYVEAHGTGTALGDPIEVEALAAVVGQPRPDGTTCRLGSVKTNLGHLEGAAGVAGLIKVVLAMQHETIPPHLHFKNLNPLISLEGTCLVIGHDAAPWPAGSAPRCAGISSFGFGGTNAHIVLEEAPQLPVRTEAPVPGSSSWLLPLSARSPRALAGLARDYVAFLSNGHSGAKHAVRDICYTAGLRRWHYPVRVAFAGDTREELTARVRAYLEETAANDTLPEKPGKLIFVFSGHGSQWAGMGHSLFEREPAFREAMKQCDAVLRSVSGWSVLEELAAPDDCSHLDETEVFQPVLFAIQTALAALWRSWGIVPEAVLGHSVGEIAAAHVAGAITLEDASKIAVHRGRLMQAAAGRGAMAAVEISADEAKDLIARHEFQLTVAAINAPHSITLSGAADAIDQCLAELAARGVQGRRVKVNCAFHSPQMISYADALEKNLASLSPVDAAIPVYSTVEGRTLEGSKFDAAYWGRNIREPVQFAAATAAALRAGFSSFLELSPHPVLGSALKQCLETSGTKGAVLASMRRGQDERATLLTSLGSLYTLGKAIQWKALHPEGGNCISLPPYPWQRERHWATPSSKSAVQTSRRTAAEAEWPGRVLRSAFFDGVVVETEISAIAPPFIDDHRLCGVAMVPATAMIDLALTAARRALTGEIAIASNPALSTAGKTFLLEDFAIDQALVVPDNERRVLQLGFKPASPDGGSFQLFSRPVDTSRPWTLHAGGSVRLTSFMDVSSSSAPEAPTLNRARALCSEPVDVEFHYRTMRERGIEFGPLFHGVEALWRGAQAGLARIRITETPDGLAASHSVHPVLLDACLQAIAPAIPNDPGGDGSSCAYLPVTIERLWLSDNLPAARWSFARLRDQPETVARTLIADVRIFDQAGQTVGTVRGLSLKRTERSRLVQLIGTAAEGWLHEVCWERQPLPRRDKEAATRFEGRCLVFADRGGIARRFAERATQRGAQCVIVQVGERFRCTEERSFEVAPAVGEGFRSLLRELRRCGQWPVHDVVHFWGLDLPPAASDGARSFSEEQVLSVGSVLHLVQALNAEQTEKPPRIWLVSRSAVSITEEESAIEPTQAPVWGLGHVISLEHPEFRCTKLDLHGEETTIASSVDQLCDELCAQDETEDRVVLSAGQRFVARLRRLARLPTPVQRPPFASSCVALHTVPSGVLEQLNWQPCERRAPAADEVEIEVTCAGLNFRDVLVALKMVPGFGERLGGECAGRIVSVGKGVKQFQAGDDVIAVALGGLASYVTVSTDLVIHKPKSVSLDESAGLPIIFLTALYAFRRVATLHAGEKVLIHAAAGGVGSAAVQLAKLAGAEIFGTAGSPEKRALLKAWGVQHVFDSRSLSFADAIRAVAGERGIDVVLNSLAGEFATRSLELVRAGGVFVELGKRDLLNPRQVACNYPGVSYTAFDLADVSAQDPQVIRSLFAELKMLVESSAVRLPPTQVFPAQKVAHAFRHMAQGRHVGKIVIRLKTDETGIGVPSHGPLQSDGVWLVTGGLGGLGLHLARWLVGQGVSRLALIGRRAPDEAASRLLDELRGDRTSVETFQADVCNSAQLGQVLGQVRERLGPLRGVVHAAGVLDDGAIAQLDWPRCCAVLSPKLDGAWNLHASTSGDALDAFVLFSSAASVLGSPGQANYAAANAFLDALAHHRHTQGLPAISVNWGAWADAGMAANLVAKHRDRLAARGSHPIPLEDGFAALGELLNRDVTQVVAIPADWTQYVQKLPGHTSPSLLRDLVSTAPASDPTRPEAGVLTTLTGLSASQLLARMQQLVEAHAAHALGLAPGKPIDPLRPLHEVGLDSLMSVELRNALAASLGRSLSATLLFDYPTIDSLTRHLAEDVLQLELADRTAFQDLVAPDNQDLKELQKMSESEAESLLLAELDQLKK